MRPYFPSSFFRYLSAVCYCALLLGCDSRAQEPVSSFVAAHGGLESAALGPESRLALIGSRHQGISLWRTADKERLFDWRHHEEVPTVLTVADFAGSAPFVLTAEQATLTLWQTQSGQAERFWSAPSAVLAMALDAKGGLALLGLENASAVLFDVRRGGVLRNLRHSVAVSSVALDEAGKIAITGSRDGLAATWSLESGKKMAEVQHRDNVAQVALSPDGKTAFSVGEKDRALLWDSQNGEIKGEIDLSAAYLRPGKQITAVRFSEDGQYLLVGKSGQSVTLWDVGSWRTLAAWKLPRSTRWPPTSPKVLDVGFTGDAGRYFAVASDGKVYQLQRPVHP